jgi:hypothetical protein
MRDALPPLQRAVAGLRVTDGSGGTRGLSRPGFRLAADAATRDARRRVNDAYDAYERDLITAYQNPVGFGFTICPGCSGSGLDQNLAECPLCHGKGTVLADYEGDEDEILDNTETHTEGMGRNRRRVDHRTVGQMTRDHQNKMADIYDKLDHEMSEAWRG